MFLDEATIELRGGNGGRGCVSWRREKFVPKGGPDGGDGGKGGDVILLADQNTDTFSDFASRKVFEAEHGHYGLGKNKRGKDGEDLLLPVPPGTVVKDAADGTILADLREHGDQALLARGGRGGYGNAHFLSSVRQRPDFAELGDPGEHRKVQLTLKLVADVGIIGLPSSGKSTLISVVSAARPKIAEYPFTTLVPNLGVVHIADRSFILCDVPGLIEGASDGKGLGHQFLRHIERCGILLHLLDLSHALTAEGGADVSILAQDYRTIRTELMKYSPVLAEKQELVVLNKCDLLPEGMETLAEELSERFGIRLDARLSAATTAGTKELMQSLLPLVLTFRERQRAIEQTPPESEDLPVLEPQRISDRMGAYRITRREDGSIIVRGDRIEQFVRMTNFTSPGAVRRFRDVVERIGLSKALRRESERGSATGEIFIGDIPVSEHIRL